MRPFFIKEGDRNGFLDFFKMRPRSMMGDRIGRVSRKNLTRPEDKKLLRPGDYIDVGTCSGHCANADTDKV